MSQMMDRRTLLRGLACVIAAPAIVRASSLMPVKAWVEPIPELLNPQAFINQYRSEVVRRMYAAEIWRAGRDMDFYAGQQWKAITDIMPSIYVP